MALSWAADHQGSGRPLLRFIQMQARLHLALQSQRLLIRHQEHQQHHPGSCPDRQHKPKNELDPGFRFMTSSSQLARDLLQEGLCLLQGAVDSSAIQELRSHVLNNLQLLRNTRENSSSGHLAGFHRYPRLEFMHTLLSHNVRVESVLSEACPGCDFRTIGLSDITINRSQEWHVDLLRGRFSSFLDQSMIWNEDRGGGVFKVLLYLQAGKSLRYISGSHRLRTSLESDSEKELIGGRPIQQASVNAGDIVLIDIRLRHRGSTQQESSSPILGESPKILLSTVLGSCNHALADQMELGNASRQRYWDERNKSRSYPQLASNAC